MTYLSAAAAQVLMQSKTLWAAFFSVLVLGKRFSWLHWMSFVVLVVGVVLVQNQDAKALFSGATAEAGSGQAFIGVGAALIAASLSGFAGVYLERTFNRDAASLWELNVHLATLSIPLQALAILEFDRASVADKGLLYGFHHDTWLVVLIQAAGGLLTALVIKYAGNMLKSFATSVSLLTTSLISMPMLGYQPTALFWAGLALVCTATTVYAAPTPTASRRPTRTSPVDDAATAADGEEVAQVREKGSRRVRSAAFGSKATRFGRMVDEGELFDGGAEVGKEMSQASRRAKSQPRYEPGHEPRPAKVDLVQVEYSY